MRKYISDNGQGVGGLGGMAGVHLLRAIVFQFEITDLTRQFLLSWIDNQCLSQAQYLFPSRLSAVLHLSTRQYGRIVTTWVNSIGLDSTAYGTHWMRRHRFDKLG